ncbi:MAG: sigma-70 family RNA polymerase sigma factor [Chloroflexi bacterium]|nr:sigma-70 family RNA polymerase sigma factor [Chloroflexota bacterium]
MPAQSDLDCHSTTELVAATQRGDLTAQEVLYRRFRPLLEATVASFRRGYAGHADLSQETARFFLELVRAFSAEREGNFATYLKARLHWHIARYLRAEDRRRGRECGLVDSHGELLVEPAVPGPEPVGIANPRLRRALARLSPRQRAIIAGFYWQDRETQEIACELGVTTQAVTAVRRRAEATLRRLLLEPASPDPEAE